MNFIFENKKGSIVIEDSINKFINEENQIRMKKKISHNFLKYESHKKLSDLNFLKTSPKQKKKNSLKIDILNSKKDSINSTSKEEKKSHVGKSKNLLSKEDSNIKYLISNIIKEINNPIRKTSKKLDIHFSNTKKSKEIEIQSHSNGIIESHRSHISKSDDDSLELINNKPSYFIGISKSNIRNKVSEENISQDGENELKDYANLGFPLNICKQDLHEYYQKDFSYKLNNRNRELFKHKNIYDSLSEGDYAEEENDKWYFINPISFYKIIWDLLGLTLIVYILIYIPYYLAFNLFIKEELYYDMLITLYFVIDIILLFVTGFFENDVIIYNVNKILNQKIYKMLFFINLISTFPFDTILYLIYPEFPNYDKFYITDMMKYNYYFEIYVFSRRLKWLQLLRFFRLSQKIESIEMALRRYIVLNFYMKITLGYLCVFLIMIYYVKTSTSQIS